MQEVIYGNSIIFTKTFLDSSQSYYEPVQVKFSIVKNVNAILYGPYLYDNSATPEEWTGEFQNPGAGVYIFSQYIEDVVVPGVYAAKWEAEIDGVVQVSYEDFQVIEPTRAPNRIIDPPSTYGVIRETPLYNDLSIGLTDRIVLIGHANGLELNSPHRVVNMQETLNKLGADGDSPLVRGLLEAYNAGARDIWLVAAAPMSEYLPFDYTDQGARKVERPDFNNLTFYQRYSQRLDLTYEMLRQEDFPEIIVPLEAPFYDSGDVDFLTPMLFNCLQRYRETGSVSVGIIGTRISFNATNVAESLMSDPRISVFDGTSYSYSTKNIFSVLKYHYGISLFKNDTQTNILDGQDIGKFGMIVAGEAIVNVPQLDLQYSASLPAVTAALLATRDINQSIIHKRIPRVNSLVGYKFTKDEVRELSRKRINAAILTPLGNRGFSYEVFLPTDNTLANGWPQSSADDQSAYWSLSTLRLISKISQQVVALGKRNIGTIQYAQFQQSVRNYLSTIRASNYIRGFNVNIYRGDDENRTVYVDLVLTPYFSLREIYFTVKVGPGTGE